MSKMTKTFLILGWLMAMASVLMLYFQGVNRSFFHQDDVVELAVAADWQGWSTVAHMNNEHLNISFWPLLRLQWLIAGTSYAPYLAVNMLMHLVVLGLMLLITYRLTKSWVLSSLPVWGMVINSNWFTVVWWITGQMFFLTTIFALSAYWMIIQIREGSKARWRYVWLYLFSILPGLSWGVGLTWPIWPLLVFGIDYLKKRLNKIGYVLVAAQATLVAIYFPLSAQTLAVHTDPATWLTNPLKILSFAVVGISNTLVGRWLWPSEDLRVRVLCLAVLALGCWLVGVHKKLTDRNIWLGMVVAGGSFITFAIPRWRFGIGHAMANYYAYFPLAFLLIGVAVLLSRFKLSKLMTAVVLSVFLIHMPMAWIGFEEWAGPWVARPQLTRQYFKELEEVSRDECLENRFIPTYIVPQEKWRIDFMWPIFKKEFNPFCDGNNR